MNFLNNPPDLLTSIVSILFLIASLSSVFFYLYFFRLAGRVKKNKPVSNPSPPVSVIICSRNESGNLEKHLPYIFEQEYPDFEVIVVDDCSTDDTQEVLSLLGKKYRNLKQTRILKDNKFHHNKKLALTIGIKAAKYEHLLLTDADCYPLSKHWITRIVSNYSEKTEIVVAYGGYETRPGILNKLIRYEAVFTAMQYMGFAGRGIPYMGVGRNLSYKKTLFFKNKGFASHLKLDSGDDDLFVSETASAENVRVENHPESFTISIPKTCFKEWLWQRKRHFTTGSLYKPKIKFLLGAEYLGRIVLLASFLFLLINGFLYQYVVGIFFIVLIVKGIVYKIVLQGLKERYLFIFSLLIELFIPYFYTLVHISNILDKKTK